MQTSTFTSAFDGKDAISGKRLRVRKDTAAEEEGTAKVIEREPLRHCMLCVHVLGVTHSAESLLTSWALLSTDSTSVAA
jgi:hypothetical protein